MKLHILILTVIALLFTACSENTPVLEVTLQPGDYDLVNTSVFADVNDNSIGDDSRLCAYSGDHVVPAQVEQLPESGQRIWWNASKPAGESVTYSFRNDGDCNDEVFEWETGAESSRLVLGNQPLLQYEHPVYDPENIEQTSKPFHHLYDPAGEQIITKGPGGLYPHHRGIFFGYNHIYIDDNEENRVNIWSSNTGERAEHVEVLEQFAGPVMGGHVVKLDWKNREGEKFLDEKREVRVFKQSDDVAVIDFRSTLSTERGSIRLDGDRQHAGVQFRAAQYVADNSDQTRFVRPDYLAHLEPDDEIEGPDMMDLPWNTMQFVVDGQPYMVSYLSHPSNPDEAEMSERLYGRFGEFFRYEVTPENPLQVQYRFVVKAGELSTEELDVFYQQYANAPVAGIN